MGRKRIDPEIMQEVVADLDVESLNKPIVTHRFTQAPVVTAPLLSYRSKSKSRPRRWAVGVAGVAAAMAVAAIFLSYSPGGIGRFLQATVEASAAFRHLAASARSSTDSTSASSPIPTAPSEIVGELSTTASEQSSPPSSDVETLTVVVQSGETLRRIALRTVGQFNGEIIEQIRKLNPTITDVNHLEAGQEIKLPRLSVSLDSPRVDEVANTTGRN
jgi:hypothetical protein